MNEFVITKDMLLILSPLILLQLSLAVYCGVISICLLLRFFRSCPCGLGARCLGSHTHDGEETFHSHTHKELSWHQNFHPAEV